MLAGNHPSTTIVYNAVRRHFAIHRVIIEDAVPMRQFLTRRIKRLGLATVLGQVFFKLLIEPYLRFSSRVRMQELKDQFSFDETEIDEAMVMRVDSVNSDQVEAVLRELQPDAVIVNGTRII